ncbi:MAG: hypothetical protein OHK0022_03960 [Roseiflexaceae bacterium]
MHTHAQRKKKTEQTDDSPIAQPALTATSFSPAATVDAVVQREVDEENAVPEQAGGTGHRLGEFAILSDRELEGAEGGGGEGDGENTQELGEDLEIEVVPETEGLDEEPIDIRKMLGIEDFLAGKEEEQEGEQEGVVQRSAMSGVIQRRIDDDARLDRGQNLPANASPNPPSFVNTGQAGHVQGPRIRHDHGFLDDGRGNIDPNRRQNPTWQDHASRAAWVAKLEAAEALRPDLIDGTAAYRHFLFGNGRQRTIAYDRFLANDESGGQVLISAITDTRNAVRQRHDAILRSSGSNPPASSTIDVRTDPISVGNGSRYPYPATENWQKAIGAHQIWIEAHFTVTVDATAGTRRFQGTMTIHFEDMYNFNPGAADIATGTPDSANGRFEITGLGQEYLNTGRATRRINVTEALNSTSAGQGNSNVGGAGRTPGRPDGSRRYPGRR